MYIQKAFFLEQASCTKRLVCSLDLKREERVCSSLALSVGVRISWITSQHCKQLINSQKN